MFQISAFPARLSSTLALSATLMLAACGGGSGDATSTVADAAPTQGAAGDSTSVGQDAVYTSGPTPVAGGATPTAGEDTTADAAAAAAETAASAASAVDASASSASKGAEAVITIIPTTSTAPAAASSNASTAGHRPAGNTGTGFYVSGSHLYDPSGKEFRMRGVNHDHWDQTAAYTGIPLTGANVERIHVDFNQTAATNMKLINAALNAKIVPVLGNWKGTCFTDVDHLTAVVDTWVAQAATWTPLNDKIIVNIANEWGPANSAVWRDAYITAIQRMRAAGYTGTLMVDSGGCGQNVADIVNYGAAVLAADPQKNILFDLHIYGSFATVAATYKQGLAASFASLVASGLPVIIGEFGPGKNIGYSPTLVEPLAIVALAEASGFGWLVWAYDDNNLSGCKTDDDWFGMTKYCAKYTGVDSDLTAFGQLMVPIIKSLARPATF